MDKKQVYDFLNRRGVWFEITEHPAVYNMAEMAQISIPYPDADAKNLFVRDDKKRSYYLITVRGDKRVDLKAFRAAQQTRPLSFASADELKAFRAAQQTRPLSFASADELKALLGLIPGAVTPLGILNDAAARVKVFIDRDFLQAPGLIGVHPNENTATVWMKTVDLVEIIRKHGNAIEIISL